jgi:hypothetical protein
MSVGPYPSRGSACRQHFRHPLLTDSDLGKQLFERHRFALIEPKELAAVLNEIPQQLRDQLMCKLECLPRVGAVRIVEPVMQTIQLYRARPFIGRNLVWLADRECQSELAPLGINGN